jgi:SAM-dependent methyltransferase
MAADRRAQRSAARTAVVWDVLRSALADRAGGPAATTVLDIGGGTGGFAVPLAELGCAVEVVDPSPDSLAALERRAAEAGVGERVRPRQGDASDVVALLGAAAVDLVVCHSVLEVVEDPEAALRDMVTVLRPGGAASVLVANRTGATVARVAAGRLTEAGEMLRSATGVAGAGDPLRRRFTVEQLTKLVAAAGLGVVSTHGVRVFADSAPNAVLDTDPAALAELVALESATAGDPAYFGVAAALHVLARKPPR